MADLKFLTPVQISGSSGSSTVLKVFGSGSISGGLTVSNGLTVSAGDVSLPANSLTASQVNNFTSDVRGQFSNGTGVTITNGSVAIGQAVGTTDSVTFDNVKINGNITTDDNESKSLWTNVGVGSTITVGASGSTVQIAGNLTVKGTTTSVESTIVNVGDKNINLGTGSATLSVLDGGGIDLGTGAEVQWRYNNTSTAWKSNVDVDVASTKKYRINGTEVLSSTALGSGVTASSLTSVGTLSGLTVGGSSTLSGTVLYKSNTEMATGGQVYVSTASLNDLTGTLDVLFQGLSQVPDTSGLLSKQTYKDFRSYSYATKGVGSTVQFILSGSGVNGSNGSAAVTASCPVLLSGSSAAGVATAFRYASFDVSVREQGTNIWKNDLVSVQIEPSALLNSYYWPLVTVEAPALASGGEIRLIVVQEAAGEVI